MKTIEEVENNCKNEKIELDGSSMLFFKNSEKIQNFIIKELGKIKQV